MAKVINLPFKKADAPSVTSELEASFAATIRSLEERLESAIQNATGEVQQTRLNLEIRRALDRIERRLKRELAHVRNERDGDIADDINRLLSALDPSAQRDFAKRKLDALRMRLSGGDVDAYGKDAVVARRTAPFLDFVFSRYFRTEVSGLENVRKSGRVLFVCNHGGILPWDTLMLAHAVEKHHPQHREVRPLIEDGWFHFPFLGLWLNRLGAVRACQENAERMLSEERAIAVFPEGQKGIAKPFSERYELARFARGGFVKLAMRTGASIVPVAIIGSEEAHPLLARLTWLVSGLGLGFLPITPTFPLFGLLGLVPLPVKWRIRFGEAIDLQKNDENDRLLVTRLTEDVRARVQQLVDETREERGSPLRL